MSDILMQATWHNQQQAADSWAKQISPWCKAQLTSGHPLSIEIRLAEDCKTDRQRAYYHGVVLTQIAQQARPGDQRFSLATWKEHFRKEYLCYKTVTYTNPITGKKSRRRVRISTEDLGVKAYSILIEKVTSFAVTELGVSFDAPMDIDPETGEVLA